MELDPLISDTRDVPEDNKFFFAGLSYSNIDEDYYYYYMRGIKR